MTEEERQANRDKSFAQVTEDLKRWDGASGHWYWLSFADPAKPKGDQFLGACIVFSPTLGAATACAHALKINPGGEAVIEQLPDDVRSFVHPRWSLRLLSRAECEECNREAGAWRIAQGL